MMRKYFAPFLALAGASFGLLTVYWSQKQNPVPPILFPPPSSPYAHTIAASGLIEASSENISIGTPFTEIVEEVCVKEGDRVEKGTPLFRLNTETLQANLQQAEASVKAAQVDVENKRVQYAFYERLQDKNAASAQVIQQAFYALLEAEEALKIAEANAAIVQTQMMRSLVRAPVAGEILQVNLHVGEIAPVTILASSQSTWQTQASGSLLLMGLLDPMQVRVDVAEEDAWRLQKGAPATAFVRGNSRISFPLTFVRIEPYLIPKRSFTGSSVERVDTRVLQVLYQFERKHLPVYPGQILDVFISANPT